MSLDSFLVCSDKCWHLAPIIKMSCFLELFLFNSEYSRPDCRLATRALSHQTLASTCRALVARCPSWGTRPTTCSPASIPEPRTWCLSVLGPPRASARRRWPRSPPTSQVSNNSLHLIYLFFVVFLTWRWKKIETKTQFLLRSQKVLFTRKQVRASAGDGKKKEKKTEKTCKQRLHVLIFFK